ncbi:MAG TPA: 2-oxo acid dehydrogenase subunit E2, partial [Streptosporangiaceae bacterium]|nr:2-oxo acid dehydrogenase subunit E2 [Streptosporangiaceae bacterium]
MPEFTMPSLGADMDEGTLQEWLVKPGDVVSHGDVVAVVETDKAAIEVECFADGVIDRLLVEPGQRVPVGAPLAVIAAAAAAGRPAGKPARKAGAKAKKPAEPPREAPREAPREVPHEVPSAAAPSRAVPPSEHPAPRPRVTSPLVRHLAEEKGVDLASVRGTGRAEAITRADVEAAVRRPSRLRASPLARRLAQELGVDLRDVAGTGAHGAIRAEDVQHAAKAEERPAEEVPRPAEEVRRPAATRAVPADDRQAAMRRAIGRLMARSKREIPHYYLSTTIDLHTALDWMQATNSSRPVAERLVPSALLLKATALAARDVPAMNGFFENGEFAPSDAVHLGVAVALRKGGLVAPALHDADTLPLDQLMAGLRDLVARARGGRLQRAEMTDSTITVTNLGDLGVESVFGVVFPPQVALVGFGRV